MNPLIILMGKMIDNGYNVSLRHEGTILFVFAKGRAIANIACWKGRYECRDAKIIGIKDHKEFLSRFDKWYYSMMSVWQSGEDK